MAWNALLVPSRRYKEIADRYLLLRVLYLVQRPVARSQHASATIEADACAKSRA